MPLLPYFRTLGVEAGMSEVDSSTWNSSPNGIFKKEVGERGWEIAGWSLKPSAFML